MAQQINGPSINVGVSDINMLRKLLEYMERISYFHPEHTDIESIWMYSLKDLLNRMEDAQIVLGKTKLIWENGRGKVVVDMPLSEPITKLEA